MGLFHSPVAYSRQYSIILIKKLITICNYNFLLIFSKIIVFHFKPGYLLLIGKALIMAYIYLYSAADEADMRELTSPMILLMVTDEGENYCCAVAWGHFQPR